MKYSTVLFDLDGTLTDPVQGICGSVRYALEKAGRPVGPIESYHKYIGPPLLRSFEVYANATPEEAQELLGYYRERFSTVGLFENEVYPGIPELLRDLKASGVRIAVATGKPTVFSEQILEHFGLRQYIDVVSGIPLDREPPDKCEVILHALYEMGISDRSACVMEEYALSMPCAMAFHRRPLRLRQPRRAGSRRNRRHRRQRCSAAKPPVFIK
jgi:phosphoglycolate phosphatase